MFSGFQPVEYEEKNVNVLLFVLHKLKIREHWSNAIIQRSIAKITAPPPHLYLEGLGIFQVVYILY